MPLQETVEEPEPLTVVPTTFHGGLLADLSALSIGLCVLGLCTGIALWWTGWRLHRFWLVFLGTAFAGVAGLISGRALGSQMLISGLLLAFSAGMLAVELARLVVFTAGGFSVVWATHMIIPALREPLVVFLTGGLIAVVLFRLWVMLLTSLLGTLLGGTSAFVIIGKLTRANLAIWADQRLSLLAGGIVLLTLGGLVAQSLLERWWVRRQQGEQPETPPPDAEHKAG